MRSALSRHLSGHTSIPVALSLLIAVVACSAPGPDSADTGPAGPGLVAPQPPERLRAEVLETLPHDSNAFTQGLEIAHGTLYESTGRVGLSSVVAVDMTSGNEKARVKLPAPMFGEGITVTESALWQLTWRDGIALERDPDTLRERRRVSYQGEGWGICHQAKRDRLVMSDGTDMLTFRDPDTFEQVGRVRVRSGGAAVSMLNELECVDDLVYANVWQTDTIVRIDPDTGKVTAEIDASGLLTDAERAETDVLNGIASVPGSEAFFVTGKLWPHIYRVRFTPLRP